MDKPVIAITMGDAAGIGPELIAKVLADPAAYGQCRPLVIGDPAVMQNACRLAGGGLTVRAIADIAAARFAAGVLDVLAPPGLALGRITLGAVDPLLGQAAALCLAQAYELAQAGRVQGVVSAPLNKQALHEAGYHYLDELEYLADITQSPEPFIIGAISPALWTIAVTGHIAFAAIAPAITQERVLRYIQHLQSTLLPLGFRAPRLAVAALNVHGGEGGLFGREEQDAIAPAIARARQQGLLATGPCPADTVFVRAHAGEFDGVVCMYHDQANIARKLLATRRGATLFMGLPVVCATTAHGTAFDKAGQGIADPGSLADALHYAVALCP